MERDYVFERKGTTFLSQTLFSNPYIIQPLLFRNFNSARSNDLKLKYKRFTPSGFNDRVIKFQFVAKNNVFSFLEKENITLTKL